MTIAEGIGARPRTVANPEADPGAESLGDVCVRSAVLTVPSLGAGAAQAESIQQRLRNTRNFMRSILTIL